MHHKFCRHNKVTTELEGELITQDRPQPGIFEAGSFSHEVEAPPFRPFENQVIRKPQDVHVLANRIEIDPLRISPYVATPTRPLSFFIEGAPAGNFLGPGIC